MTTYVSGIILMFVYSVICYAVFTNVGLPLETVWGLVIASVLAIGGLVLFSAMADSMGDRGPVFALGFSTASVAEVAMILAAGFSLINPVFG